MNAQLTRDDLYSLEQYDAARQDFRAKVMAHKKPRQIALGDHLRLYFEDKLTIHYQVQEMLRAEKIFNADGIQDELDAYNPLIPDGSNLKATMMVEYEDVEERKQRLKELIGIEQAVYLQVEGFDKVRPIANEDLKRSDEEKTSAVHFTRFEFSDEMRKALKDGAALLAGCDHDNYPVPAFTLDAAQRDALVADLA